MQSQLLRHEHGPRDRLRRPVFEYQDLRDKSKTIDDKFC